jgi:methanogenic corrinoid protein MtbC1
MPGSSAPLDGIARRYLQLLLNAERSEAIDLIMHASEEFPLETVYIQVLQASQYEIGRLWETAEISVAQEHYCTAVTQVVMSLLFPRISETPKHGRTFLGTCLESELHEVGMRMVCDIFELRGWKSVYLGAANPVAGILQMARDRAPDAIGISISRDENIPAVRHLIEELRAAEVRRVPILAGGAPFNAHPELWREVGADGCAGNAVEAVILAEMLCDAGNST